MLVSVLAAGVGVAVKSCDGADDEAAPGPEAPSWKIGDGGVRCVPSTVGTTIGGGGGTRTGELTSSGGEKAAVRGPPTDLGTSGVAVGAASCCFGTGGKIVGPTKMGAELADAGACNTLSGAAAGPAFRYANRLMLIDLLPSARPPHAAHYRTDQSSGCR